MTDVQRFNRLLACLLLLVGVSQAAAGVDWQWRTGRATNYGGSGDPWTIHHGSCRYNYLDPTVNKGWDVAALPDAVHDYKGSCGRCYEIGCAPMHLKDGYGTGLDRSHVCFDSTQTVVVMITDSCPCDYPPNQYSNKRWCCGDYYHFDMSTWSFEKLAERKWGVIGIRYREVPCDYCPEKPALLLEGVQPEAPVQNPPDGWQPSWDKRPSSQMCFTSSLERQDANGQKQDGGDGGAGGGGDGGGDGNGGASAFAMAVATSDAGGSTSSATASATSTSTRSASEGTSTGSDGDTSQSTASPSTSLLSGWKDIAAMMRPWSTSGPDGQSTYCGTVDGGASISFEGATGSLSGKRKLQIDVKTENGRVPDFSLSLSSSKKGSCRTVELRSVEASRNGDWAHLTVPLINMNWWSSWFKSGDLPDFSGCSNSIGAWDVDTIHFKNNWGNKQALCLANVKAS